MGSVWPRGAVFWLLGYVFGYVALLVVALALSSALYLVAEYAEEFPSFAGKVIKYSLVLVLSLHLLLWFDGMPWFESVVGIACNVCYASMLSTFPFVEILSVRSIASALAFLAAHYIWFSYFLNSGSDILHVVGFFVVMVWFVPGGLFVSLAINDNVLPGVSGSKLGAGGGVGGGVGGGGSQKGTNLFKTLFDFVQERAVPACINAWNAVASRAGQTSTRITGGGAYGRQKKGEDYVNSANDGYAYGGGVGGGGGGGVGGGGYGGGSSIYQQQPQYQQQQQQQYQQYQQEQQQQQQQQQYPQQQQYAQQQPPSGYQQPPYAEQPGSFMHPSGAGLKRR